MARAGAGKAIQSDVAQKKAMEFLSPMVGDALDKLGDKVAGQEGGFLPLLALGGLIPGLAQQLGAGSDGSSIYESGTDPYQEGGLFPLLGLAGLIPGLMKQLGAGSSSTYESGTDPYQEGGLLPLLRLIPGLFQQLGAGSSSTYESGTHPYQEGGLFPLLGLTGLIPGLMKQVGSGRKKKNVARPSPVPRS